MQNKLSEFDEFVLYRALHHKFIGTDSVVGELAEKDLDQYRDIRNVCAKVHVSIVNRLDSACGFLEITKRTFIERALLDALDRAESVIGRVIDDIAVEQAQTHPMAVIESKENEPAKA